MDCKALMYLIQPKESFDDLNEIIKWKKIK